MGKFMNADDIIQINDITHEDVIVPEWNNGTVRVIGLSAAQAQEYLEQILEVGEDGSVRKKRTHTIMTDLLIRALADENNKPLFTADNQKALQTLDSKSSQAIRRLFQIAQRLSGLGQQSRLDQLKNSKGTTDADSHSA